MGGYGGYYTTYDPNVLGRVLAHEVGHVLSLQHRAGNEQFNLFGQDFTDGLENQKNAAGQTLNYTPGSNLMDHPTWGPNIPEDIDLHQALIMRNHVGNGTSSLLLTSPP